MAPPSQGTANPGGGLGASRGRRPPGRCLLGPVRPSSGKAGQRTKSKQGAPSQRGPTLGVTAVLSLPVPFRHALFYLKLSLRRGRGYVRVILHLPHTRAHLFVRKSGALGVGAGQMAERHPAVLSAKPSEAPEGPPIEAGKQD